MENRKDCEDSFKKLMSLNKITMEVKFNIGIVPILIIVFVVILIFIMLLFKKKIAARYKTTETKTTKTEFTVDSSSESNEKKGKKDNDRIVIMKLINYLFALFIIFIIIMTGASITGYIFQQRTIQILKEQNKQLENHNKQITILYTQRISELKEDVAFFKIKSEDYEKKADSVKIALENYSKTHPYDLTMFNSLEKEKEKWVNLSVKYQNLSKNKDKEIDELLENSMILIPIETQFEYYSIDGKKLSFDDTTAKISQIDCILSFKRDIEPNDEIECNIIGIENNVYLAKGKFIQNKNMVRFENLDLKTRLLNNYKIEILHSNHFYRINKFRSILKLSPSF